MLSGPGDAGAAARRSVSASEPHQHRAGMQREVGHSPLATSCRGERLQRPGSCWRGGAGASRARPARPLPPSSYSYSHCDSSRWAARPGALAMARHAACCSRAPARRSSVQTRCATACALRCQSAAAATAWRRAPRTLPGPTAELGLPQRHLHACQRRRERLMMRVACVSCTVPSQVQRAVRS